MEGKLSMPYCIICKEIIDKRYLLKACDSLIKNCIEGHVCRHCFNKLIESKHDKGFFKLARLTSWARHRRDSMRL
jgi:hypothetical protein